MDGDGDVMMGCGCGGWWVVDGEVVDGGGVGGELGLGVAGVVVMVVVSHG